MKKRQLGILLLSAVFVFTEVQAGDDARALAPASAQVVPAAELEFGPVTAEPEGLSSQPVADLKSGAVFKVHFDKASAGVAKRSTPILAAFYRQIASLVAMPASDVEWHSVLFADNADDLVLTRKDGETLWRVDVGADGELSQNGIKQFYSTIPHEQVHATQADDLKLPRWFAEGQASWAEFQIMPQWKPELARAQRDKRAAAVTSSEQPLALGGWGGVKIKQAAIDRQLTPEQRERQKKDPSWNPPGPFSFEDGDFTMDMSNEAARYGGSLALFERIDRQAGREALQAWFKAVREAGPKLNSEKLAALALQHTKVDIAADLK